jgi:hypothetical protein
LSAQRLAPLLLLLFAGLAFALIWEGGTGESACIKGVAKDKKPV